MSRRSRGAPVMAGLLVACALLGGWDGGRVAGAAEARTAYATIASEDFEGLFPTGLWSAFDASGMTDEYHWDDTPCGLLPPGSHTWCAWPAAGGHDGFDPHYPTTDYPGFMDSWMVYGPFDLRLYHSARLVFYYWNVSVPADPFSCGASGDGSSYQWTTLKNDAAWDRVEVDLSGYAGDDSVWIAFRFQSDAAGGADGPYVDDIVLEGIPLVEARFRSTGAYDGWVLEKDEASGRGGAFDAASSSLLVGDDALDRQYRSVLDFDTSSLPDTAVVTDVTLRVKRRAIEGTNPFATHGLLRVDVTSGFYHGVQALERFDFQARGSRGNVGRFVKAPSEGWYRAPLRAAANPWIHLAGTTQLRLRFALDDDDDLAADYLAFWPGDAPTEAYRPELIVTYYVP